MAPGSFLRLYTAATPPAEAFLLSEGVVYFFVTDADKYAVKGSNLIIGATELVLNGLVGKECSRLETAITDSGSVVKKIPAEKFLASMSNYSFAINISMVMAKQVLLTNQIINKNMGSLKGDEMRGKEIAVEYYRIVARLKKEWDKRRLPWLKQLAEKYEANLLFKRGEAFDRGAEATKISAPITMSDTTLEFPGGSVICEEGSVGDEMYILQSGTIDVYMNGNRITGISEAGYVFGEMALLLGEKRSATLKAKGEVVLTRLKRSNLKDIAQQHGDVLLSIIKSLAEKHLFNIEKIAAINGMILEKALSAQEQGGSPQKVLDKHRAENELAGMKRELETQLSAKKADFLDDLTATF
ncbi:MAG: cyclic nucleotide-binding domain-containing protein [Spirochaetes bacterium]|nr:MAG: cyclic nucleotide-binding domain-containing protein [Spirochaetota bacterium]